MRCRSVRTRLRVTGVTACAPLRAVNRNEWNTLVAQLSGGLLFGREVPKPEWFDTRKRLRNYYPQLRRPSPRRQMVLRRLLNGWTIRQIARDMTISIRAVLNHVRALCRQEHVSDRHGLAKRFGSSHPQPLTQDDRARAAGPRCSACSWKGAATSR